MITAIGTHIKVADFATSKAFYNALGFKKVFEYGPDKKVREAYRGATFMHGGAKLEIAEGHRAVKPAVFRQRVQNSKISLMISVSSLRDVIKRIAKSGITIAVGPRHYYWGTLELVVRDPDGVVLVFIAPYSKKEAATLNADEMWGTPPVA